MEGSAKEGSRVLNITSDQCNELCNRLEKNELSVEDRALLVRVVKAMVWLTAQLELGRIGMSRLKKLIFGEKSEKKEKLFPDKSTKPEKGAQTGKPSETAPQEEPPPHKGHGRNPASDFTGAKHEYCQHETLKPGDSCPKCGKGFLHDSIENGTFLRLVGNPPISATVYETQRLRCGLCGAVFEASLPKGVPAVKWDETACTMAALSRFGYGIPHYRLETMQTELGIPISDSVLGELARGVAQCGTPIVERLVELAAQGKLLHADDTMMRVLELMKENKSRDPTRDRTGMFTTAMIAQTDGREIPLFFTGRNHCGENLAELLKKRAQGLSPPQLMVDGSSRNMPEDFVVILMNCLTHGRRQFIGLEEAFPEEVRYVIELLAKVYFHDATAKELGMTDEQRLAYHQEKSAPLMAQLKTWCQDQIATKKAEPNSALGKAIRYMEKRWNELTVFLRLPGAPLANDVVERLIKRAVLHRKSSMFYKTLEGAKVGDTLMTLIQATTRAGTNPFHYLTEIQRHSERVRENPDAWLPWNYQAQLPASHQSTGQESTS